MVKKQEGLKRYHKRRDFAKTGEPEGAAKSLSKNGVKKKKPSKHSIFVIQQHAARSMHYDVRLEIDGVLVSWAVPKGPSTDPHDKRLAVMTEDHPIEYATFEGTIPQGNYGAGEVIIWDRGSYENIKTKSMSQCLEEGSLEFFLQGEKLQGLFALVRMKADEKNWLLIKLHDEYESSDSIIETKPKSVVSDKTIGQMKKKKGAKA